MNQMQEAASNSVHYDNTDVEDQIPTTITNRNGTITQEYTVLEDLSSVTIYEILEYLDSFHVFQAFSNLNTRFQDVISSILSINVNTSIMSKSAFERYYEQFIIPNSHRINSLCLFHSFIIDLIFPSFQHIPTFSRLKTLVLNDIDSIDLKILFEHLNSISTLSSLTINSINGYCNKKILYSAIFCLPSLKYCLASRSRYITEI